MQIYTGSKFFQTYVPERIVSNASKVRYFPKIKDNKVYNDALFFAQFLEQLQREQKISFLQQEHKRTTIISTNAYGINVVADNISIPSVHSSSYTVLFDEEIHFDDGRTFCTVPIHGEDGEGFLFNKYADKICSCYTPFSGSWVFDNEINIPYTTDITEEYLEQQSFVHTDDTIFMLVLCRMLREFEISSFLCRWENIQDYALEYKLLNNYNVGQFNECMKYFHQARRKIYEEV